jgi:hypothetical protein
MEQIRSDSQKSLPSEISLNASKTSLTQIQGALKELSASPNTVISELKADSYAYTSYKWTYEAISKYFTEASPLEYREGIVNYVHSLPRPTIIVPGTYGSFLFGCLYDAPVSGNIYCSPACANSIPPTNEVEIVPCSEQVWYDDNKGTLTYKSGSGSIAKVFNRDRTLTGDEAKILYNNGVRTAIVYNKFGQIIKEAPLISLPVTAISPEVIQATPAAIPVQPLKDIALASNTGFSRGVTSWLSDWRLILLLSVVIISLGVIGYMMYKSIKSKKESEIIKSTTPPNTPVPDY